MNYDDSGNYYTRPAPPFEAPSFMDGVGVARLAERIGAVFERGAGPDLEPPGGSPDGGSAASLDDSPTPLEAIIDKVREQRAAIVDRVRSCRLNAEAARRAIRARAPGDALELTPHHLDLKAALDREGAYRVALDDLDRRFGLTGEEP